MNPSAKLSECWMKYVGEAWQQSGGNEEQAMRWFAERLGWDERTAQGFGQGVQELLQYANEPWREGTDAVDAEREAVEVSRRLVRPSFEARLQGRLERLDEGAKRQRCRSCAGSARSKGRRKRSWQSQLGPVHLSRRYVYCEACEQGDTPASRALGLPEKQRCTARLEEISTLMATTVPYQMSSQLLQTLCGVELSEKGLQEMVERRAGALQQVQQNEAQRCRPRDPQGRRLKHAQRPAQVAQKAPELAYLELDGVLPLTRDPIPIGQCSAADQSRQRQAKRQGIRGGKGRRYRTVGREVKNAVLYDGADCAAESPGRGCLLKKTYVSHLGDWCTFAALLWVQLQTLGFDRAKRLVVISDGAEWIRSLCEWLPVSTFLILDLYHVKRRIRQTAHALFGDTPKAERWARTQSERIEQGQADQVLHALRFLKPKRQDTQQSVQELCSYLNNNLDRMDYPSYRAMGLRVGSGAVESANYHVTGARLKLQGMRWTPQAAGEMSTLRADLFNGRWEQTTRNLLAA